MRRARLIFIAHLPAGYLLARLLPGLPQTVVLIGAVAPDLDMLLFHLMQGGSTGVGRLDIARVL